MKNKKLPLFAVLLIAAFPVVFAAMHFVSSSSLLATEVIPSNGTGGSTGTFPGGQLNNGGVSVPGLNGGIPGGTMLQPPTDGGNGGIPGITLPGGSTGGGTVTIPGGQLDNGGVSVPGLNGGGSNNNQISLGCSASCTNGDCISTCDGGNPDTGASTTPVPEAGGIGACVSNCLNAGTSDLTTCTGNCLGNITLGENASTTPLPFDGVSANAVENACTNVLVDPANIPSQLNNFSAPFAKTDGSLQIGVFCDDSGAKISIGDDAEATYIKRTIYAAPANGQWTPVNLAGEGVQDMSWIKGSARGDLPISASTTGEIHFVIAYICHWENNTWACGCSNDSCDSSKWNIQAYIRN